MECPFQNKVKLVIVTTILCLMTTSNLHSIISGGLQLLILFVYNFYLTTNNENGAAHKYRAATSGTQTSLSGLQTAQCSGQHNTMGKTTQQTMQLTTYNIGQRTSAVNKLADVDNEQRRARQLTVQCSEHSSKQRRNRNRQYYARVDNNNQLVLFGRRLLTINDNG
ncbi:hypothetical protein ACFE04_021351 [Oxalis oulophora]